MEKLELDIIKLEAVASKLRAIAHPMRIAILDLLIENEKLSVTEIYDKLRIEQAAASHHLNILKVNGLLSSTRSGKRIYYSIVNKNMSQLMNCISKCQ